MGGGGGWGEEEGEDGGKDKLIITLFTFICFKSYYLVERRQCVWKERVRKRERVGRETGGERVRAIVCFWDTLCFAHKNMNYGNFARVKTGSCRRSQVHPPNFFF